MARTHKRKSKSTAPARPRKPRKPRITQASFKADDERLTYFVPEAGKLLGLSRNAAYEAAKRGDLPTIKVGSRFLVPRLALQRLLSGNAA